MDLQRLFLFLIFAFSLMLIWDGWQRYQHPEQQIQQSVTTNKELLKPQSALPAGSGQTALSGTGPATIAQQSVQQTTGKTIHVKTDILEAEISTIGRSEERRVGKECRSRGSPY